MKYCSKCGAQLDDEAFICVKCGCLVNNPSGNFQSTYSRKSNTSGTKAAAKIFIIIGMILGCILIVPLIVGAIALTDFERTEPSTGLCICVLFFCSFIGGILLLCSKNERQLPYK